MRFGKSRSPAVRNSTAGGLSCRERERGLAIVEFILIVPLLLALLVGIVDFGFLFNDAISVRQGARDGGRQAAVGKFGSDMNGQNGCYLEGFNGQSNAEKLFCLTKSRDGIEDEDTRINLIVGDTSSSTYALGKPVTICVQYRMRSLTGMLNKVFNDKVFKTRTTFRVEVLNNSGGLEDAWETPLGSWSDGSCPVPTPVS